MLSKKVMTVICGRIAAEVVPGQAFLIEVQRRPGLCRAGGGSSIPYTCWPQVDIHVLPRATRG